MGRLAWIGTIWLLSQGVNYLLPAVLRYYGYDPDKIADSAVGYVFGSSSAVTYSDIQVWLFWAITLALLIVLAYPYRSIAVDRGTLGVLWRMRKPRWLHPSVALDILTDKGMRAERDERAETQMRIVNSLDIVERQIQGAIWNQQRPEAQRIAIPDSFVQDAQYKYSELWEKKRINDDELSLYRAEVMNDLYKKLLAGTLLAKGFAVPHAHGKPEVNIPPSEWRFLKFDEAMEVASGNGISYTNLLIRRA